MTKDVIKPFLRWAGGKNWLIKNLDHIVKDIKFNNYHEPFLGGASVYLAINPLNKAYLSDLNEELINTYRTLKVDPEGIIEILLTYENSADFYYDIRDKVFLDPVEQAARFIFLNQTSFNGIYRVNLDGKYNVPYGYRKKNFLDIVTLKEVSKRLQNAELSYGDFEASRMNIQPRDLVFLDPPYTVSHNNNGFIKYNQKLFSLDDQYRLSNFIDYVKRCGAYYILTNAAHKMVHEIFFKGDRVLELTRASLIGGQNAARGKISEYIFTNIDVL